MTDRELLELAARAAGVEFHGYDEKENCLFKRHITHYGPGKSYWGPLTDDRDALRLAVKLRLSVDTDYNDGSAVGSADLSMDCFHEYDPPLRFGADRNAATRRAIVRAAAAIGEGMKGST